MDSVTLKKKEWFTHYLISLVDSQAQPVINKTHTDDCDDKGTEPLETSTYLNSIWF